MAHKGEILVDIDMGTVERLAGIGCSQKEIARILGVDYRTLRYRDGFEEHYGRGEANLKQTLREKLYLRMCDPKCQPAILIFLAKNILGMADNPNDPRPDIAEDAKRLLAYVREAQRRSGASDPEPDGGDADG